MIPEPGHHLEDKLSSSQVWDRKDCATKCSHHERRRALRTHLVIHGVHAIRAQGFDGLVDEVRPPAVEHAETQVLVESFSSRSGIQPPEGTETAFRPAQKRPRCVSVTVGGRFLLGHRRLGRRDSCARLTCGVRTGCIGGTGNDYMISSDWPCCAQ